MPAPNPRLTRHAVLTTGSGGVVLRNGVDSCVGRLGHCTLGILSDLTGSFLSRGYNGIKEREGVVRGKGTATTCSCGGL